MSCSLALKFESKSGAMRMTACLRRLSSDQSKKGTPFSNKTRVGPAKALPALWPLVERFWRRSDSVPDRTCTLICERLVEIYNCAGVKYTVLFIYIIVFGADKCPRLLYIIRGGAFPETMRRAKFATCQHLLYALNPHTALQSKTPSPVLPLNMF